VRRLFTYIQANPLAVSAPCFLIVIVNLTQGVRSWFGLTFVTAWFVGSLAFHIRRRRRGGPWFV
jgi:hypothetical protein